MTIMKTMSLRSLRASLVFATSLAMSVSLTACDSDDGSEASDETGDETGETGDDQELAIIGDYVDNFAGDHSITADVWSSSGSLFLLGEFDNDAMWVVGQNDEANEFNPGLWSRFDWAWDADQLYFCQSVFDGESVEVALAGGADSADLAMGCGGFPWSMLTPA